MYVQLPYIWMLSSIPQYELVYIFAQVLGGVIGAGLAYADYIHAIDLYEGGRDIRTQATAALFAPFPVSDLSPETLIINDTCASKGWIHDGGLLVFRRVPGDGDHWIRCSGRNRQT